MHVDIDRTLCEGYGVCEQSAPEIFELDEEGDPVIQQPEVDEDLQSGAAMAEKACPMQAVRLS